MGKAASRALLALIVATGCSRSSSAPPPAPVASSSASGPPFASGTAAGAAPGGPANACTVATGVYIAGALGTSFGAGTQDSSVPKVSLCKYAPAAGRTLLVRTEIVDKAAWEASMKTAADAKTVAGLGEGAYFQANRIMGISEGQLFAYKGSTKVSINYGGMGLDMARIEAGENALMQRILGSL